MALHSFPDATYQSLLTKLVKTLEVVQSEQSNATPKGRQAVYQATTDFKDALTKAKDLANALPGGELMIDEQNSIISMLERLREAKRVQLSRFSSFSLSTTMPSSEDIVKMEIDSTASSPHN